MEQVILSCFLAVIVNETYKLQSGAVHDICSIVIEEPMSVPPAYMSNISFKKTTTHVLFRIAPGEIKLYQKTTPTSCRSLSQDI
jgi:hypothetical protein